MASPMPEAYGEHVPGPLLRARASDLLRVTLDNQLPVETSVHRHGFALRNDMDGVPHLTQDPIPAGGSFDYEFTAPDPGTYFYHPHSGVQLYGVLIVDDPAEPGGYDDEWIVVPDDWVDGTGRTPSTPRTFTGRPGQRVRIRFVNAGSDSAFRVAVGALGGSIMSYRWTINGETLPDAAPLPVTAGDRVRLRFVNQTGMMTTLSYRSGG